MKRVFMIILLCAALPAFAQKKPAFTMALLIDSIGKALDGNYIFPEKSKTMTEHLRQQMKRGRYKDLKDPVKMAGMLEADLRAAHYDGHLRVHYDPDFIKNVPPRGPVVVPDSIRLRQLNQARQNNFQFRQARILNGNIGYIEFSGFDGMLEEAKPTVTAAMRFVSNTDALIIDLRSNGGGSPHAVRQIASYLVTERTRLNDIYDRRAGKTMEFWADPGDAENMKLSMPLYILTSKGTFSAAEDFTYAMQVNKRATIVGETTGGGAHPTGPVWIGFGFVMDIPFARSINHITQTDWEGTGVLPDVAVPADRALVQAQELYLNDQEKNAGSPDRKKQARWLLDALHARDYDASIRETDLRNCVGSFDRFNIRLTEGKLYLHDHLGRTFLMSPITSRHFLASDWLQLEFDSETGPASKLTLKGKPGWVDVYERNK